MILLEGSPPGARLCLLSSRLFSCFSFPRLTQLCHLYSHDVLAPLRGFLQRKTLQVGQYQTGRFALSRSTLPKHRAQRRPKTLRYFFLALPPFLAGHSFDRSFFFFLLALSLLIELMRGAPESKFDLGKTPLHKRQTKIDDNAIGISRPGGMDFICVSKLLCSDHLQIAIWFRSTDRTTRNFTVSLQASDCLICQAKNGFQNSES